MARKICERCQWRRVVLITGRTCPTCLRESNERYRASRRAAAIRPLVQRAVWTEAQSRCEYCTIPVHRKRDRYDRSKDIGEVDHVWPAFLGGTGERRNLKLACKECNRAREVQFVQGARILRSAFRTFLIGETDPTIRAMHIRRAAA